MNGQGVRRSPAATASFLRNAWSRLDDVSRAMLCSAALAICLGLILGQVINATR